MRHGARGRTVRGGGAVIYRTTYTALIAGQHWPGVCPGTWRRGVVQVQHLDNPLGRGGEGYLATAPGCSSWAADADTAVKKLAVRAAAVMRAVAL